MINIVDNEITNIINSLNIIRNEITNKEKQSLSINNDTNNTDNINDTADINNIDITNNDKYILMFDGGSRSNPGLCGIGCVIYDNYNNIIMKHKEIVSQKDTNNFAEYNALLIGLKKCLELNIDNLHVKGDSLLVINQVTNQWKCNAPNLKHFYEEISNIKKKFSNIEFTHVLRNENKIADSLANQAMNEN